MRATPEPTLLCGDLCRTSDACAGGAKCGLCPLARFYNATARPVPVVWEIDASEIPRLQRELLVHDRDMTSTLEAFHGARTHLRLLRSVTERDICQREVVLVLDGIGRPVEFGAISIHLDRMPSLLRSDIARAEVPLGGLLHTHRVAFQSRPKSFIRIEADEVISRALELEARGPLYGRCNALLTPSGEVLADIVEILPP